MIDKDSIKLILKFVIESIKGIDEEYRLEAFKILFKFLLEEKSSKLQKSTESPEIAYQKEDNFFQLYDTINPQTYTDTAIIICYSLFKHKDISRFNINHIKEGFNKIKVPKPRNMSDTLNNLVNRGFLRSSGDIESKKAFEITKKGFEYIEDLQEKSK